MKWRQLFVLVPQLYSWLLETLGSQLTEAATP